MDKLKMGIITAGGIARTMAATVKQMDTVELVAVAARDVGRAQAFAREFEIPKAYGSYEQLVQDKAVLLVYVASPHSHHFEHAMLCVEHGKAVLCEKAFTANAVQARQLLQKAQEKKVFITEAMWTRFLPLSKTITRLVAEGAIGQPQVVTAGFGANIRHVERLVQPALAGGALLDLGVYTLTLASLVLGSGVERFSASAAMLDSGVDASDSITLHYPGNRMAVLTNSMLVRIDPRWYVYGDEGHLEINGITNPLLVRMMGANGRQATFHKRPPQISGYEYEVEACADALRQGRLECEEIPHAETLRMMDLMDAIRAQWGMRFPFEEG